jgi:RNA processing factor Prp31
METNLLNDNNLTKETKETLKDILTYAFKIKELSFSLYAKIDDDMHERILEIIEIIDGDIQSKDDLEKTIQKDSVLTIKGTDNMDGLKGRM